MFEDVSLRIGLIKEKIAEIKTSINLIIDATIKTALDRRLKDIEEKLQPISQLAAQKNFSIIYNLFLDLKSAIVDLRLDVENEKDELQHIAHASKKILINQLHMLAHFSSRHYVLPGTKIPDLKEHLQALAIRVQQIEVDKTTEFNDILQQVKALSQKTQAKVSCFLSYAWPSEERTYECWTQDFIVMFAKHLQSAGIQTYIDIEDSQFGYNSYQHMEEIHDTHFVIVFGTESLLDKHNLGISSVCVELNHVRQRRLRDAVNKQYQVIPIVLTGNMQTALPAEYERYTVVTSLIGKNYTETLKELLRHLYSCGKNQLSYNQIWKNKQFSPLPDLDSVSVYWDQIKQQHPVVTSANSNVNTAVSSVKPAKPSIISLPFRRNGAFTGRGLLINNLKTILSAPNNDTDGVMQSITGLGGTGKTQLAVEYAHQADRNNEYDLIWYLSCDNLEQDYARLAYALGVSQEAKRDEMILAVTQKLSQTPRWLLIIDEVKDYANLKEFLPSRGGHILFISREREVLSIPSIAVGTFVRAESIKFIVHSLNLSAKLADDNADKLASMLGDLPLALAQACAYMKKKGILIADYIQLFEAKRNELWQQEKPPQDYPQTIAVTWAMSIEHLSSEAKILLNYMAYLSSTHIPVSLLQQLFIVHHEPQSQQQSIAAFNEAKELLYQYSLISQSEDNHYLSVHQLVQVVVRDRLQLDDMSTSYFKHIINVIVNLASPFLHYGLDQLKHLRELRPLENRQIVMNRCREMQPHLSTIIKHLSNVQIAKGSNFPRISVVYLVLGVMYTLLGQTRQALSTLELALTLKRDSLSPASAAFIAADIHLGIALIYHELAENIKIKSHLEQSLNLLTSINSPEFERLVNSRLLNVLDGLGSIALKSNFNDEDKSKDYFQRALELSIRIYGEGYVLTGYFLNKLAGAYHQLGDVSMSRQYAKRHTAFMQKALGMSPSEYYSVHLQKLETSLDSVRQLQDERAWISLLQQMGNLYFENEQYEEALQAYLEAMEKFFQEYGSCHRGYVNILLEVGTTYFELNEYEKALEVFKEMLETVRLLNKTAPSRPDLGNAYYFLGKTYFKIDNPRTGLVYLNNARDIFLAGVGDAHPFLSDVNYHIAECYFALKDFQKSLHYYQDALNILQKIDSHDRELRASLHYGIADCYRELGEPKKALSFYKKALPIVEKRGGTQTSQIYYNIADTHVRAHQYKTAIRIYTKALKAHPDNAHIQQDAGCFYHFLGATKRQTHYFLKAEFCFKKAIAIESTASNNTEMASFLYIHRRFNEAWIYLKKNLDNQALLNDETTLCYSRKDIITLPVELHSQLNLLPKEIEFSANCFTYYLSIMILLKKNQQQQADELLTLFSNSIKENEFPDDNLLYLNAVSHYDKHNSKDPKTITLALALDSRTDKGQSSAATNRYTWKYRIPIQKRHLSEHKSIKIRTPLYKSPS